MRTRKAQGLGDARKRLKGGRQEQGEKTRQATQNWERDKKANQEAHLARARANKAIAIASRANAKLVKQQQVTKQQVSGKALSAANEKEAAGERAKILSRNKQMCAERYRMRFATAEGQRRFESSPEKHLYSLSDGGDTPAPAPEVKPQRPHGSLLDL